MARLTQLEANGVKLIRVWNLMRVARLVLRIRSHTFRSRYSRREKEECKERDSGTFYAAEGVKKAKAIL